MGAGEPKHNRILKTKNQKHNMPLKRPGIAYLMRMKAVAQIFDKQAKIGLSNREIWKRHIYPRFFISEGTMYNLINTYERLTEKQKEELEKIAKTIHSIYGNQP